MQVQSLQQELFQKSIEEAKFQAKTEMDSLVRERDEKLMNVQVRTGTWICCHASFAAHTHDTSHNVCRLNMLDCRQRKMYAVKALKNLPNSQKGI